MPDPESFMDVMARLQAGDEAAAREIVGRFTTRLVALARLHLDERLKQKVDPEDILQSMYKSFFPRVARGQYKLKNWESLWGLLTLLTVRKCNRCHARFFAAARDVRAEADFPKADAEHSSWLALDRNPTPEEVCQFVDALEQLLKGLDPLGRDIVGFCLKGLTVREISAKVRCSERMVYRIMKLVRQRLERMRDSAGDKV
jgi:RNA polymerase sigma-70 factor, ECF subfamily